MTGPRTLWMVLHEADGITGDLILEEVVRLGGSSTKLGDLSGDELEALRRACFARVGLTDEVVEARFRASSVFRDYHERLRRDPPQFRRKAR